MANAFRPPESPAETREQLLRLRDGLKRAAAVGQLPKNATPSDVARKLNDLIARLGAITQDGDGPNVVPTVVKE